MSTVQPTPAPIVFQKLAALTSYLSHDFLGGPRILKLSSVINFQKGGTLLFVLGLMAVYDEWSLAATIYLALHGSYGIIWLLKHFAFRDARWDAPVTIGGAFMSMALVLGPYWIAPFLIISDVLGPLRPVPSLLRIGVAVALHTLGVVIMVAADAQKHFTLKYRRGLIQDGMFKHVRHPNYLGEMMLYAAYAILAMHWLPWVVLAWVWSALFLTNMMMKEASMSRYPEWRAYKARTGLLFPWPFAPGRVEPLATPSRATHR